MESKGTEDDTRPSPATETSAIAGQSSSAPRPAYRECLKNHAAKLGGQVLDGCGEFMPSAAEPLKCAACGCHRSFHRKITPSLDQGVPQFVLPALPATESSSEERRRRKRHRTKFTAAQREMMAAFAERIGWRVQRNEEGALERFCREAGVSRKVFKVWMHNNKQHATRSKVQEPPREEDVGDQKQEEEKPSSSSPS